MVIGYSDDMPMTKSAKNNIESVKHTDDVHEVLSKVITRINTLNGIDMQVDADGRITGINITDGGVSINGELIKIGTEPNSPSDVIITGGQAYIRNLLMDKLQGGNLTLGGTVIVKDTTQPKIEYVNEDGTTYWDFPEITKEFLDASFTRYDNEGNAVVQIDEEKSYFENLSVGNISVGNVLPGSPIATVSTGNKVFYVDANPTDAMYEDESYDGLSEDKPLPITNMTDVIPDILNHTYTFIVKMYSTGDVMEYPDDHILFKGISGNGNILLNLNGQKIVYTICISKSTIQFYLTDGTIIYNPDSSDKPYAIQNYSSSHMECNNVIVKSTRYPNKDSNGNYEEFDGIRTIYNGMSHIEGCTIEGFRDGIYISRAHNTYALNNTGKVNRYGTSAYYSSKGTVSTKGVSSLQAGKSIYETQGGQIMKDSSPTFPYEPSSGETTQQSTVPTVTVKKRTWDATYANNYYGSYWVSSGDWKGRVVSGKWPGYPSQSGIWILPQSMRDTLKGKTIKKVTVSIYRHNNKGYAREIPFNLRMHKYLSQPSGSPLMSETYQTLKLAYGVRKTFDITNKFKALINDGTWSGFGVRSPYTDAYYASLSSIMSVTVTYY